MECMSWTLIPPPTWRDRQKHVSRYTWMERSVSTWRHASNKGTNYQLLRFLYMPPLGCRRRPYWSGSPAALSSSGRNLTITRVSTWRVRLLSTWCKQPTTASRAHSYLQARPAWSASSGRMGKGSTSTGYNHKETLKTGRAGKLLQNLSICSNYGFTSLVCCTKSEIRLTTTHSGINSKITTHEQIPEGPSGFTISILHK